MEVFLFRHPGGKLSDLHTLRSCWLIMVVPLFFGPMALAGAAPTSKGLTGRIVFDHCPDRDIEDHSKAHNDIYSVNADGTQLQALTKDGKSHNPSWSADGRRILYIHDTAWPSRLPNELYVMDSDGGNAHLLRQLDGPIQGPVSSSPDGKTLAVNYNRYFDKAGPSPDGKEICGFFLIPVQGQDEVCPMFSLTAMAPAWRPDGGKLVFMMQPSLGNSAIAVGAADGSHQVQLTGPGRNIPLPSIRDAGFPAWSPNGKQIAFNAHISWMDPQQVFVMRADGSYMRQLTTNPERECLHPTWSPDGAEVAFYCMPSPCHDKFGPSAGPAGGTEPPCDSEIFVLRLNEPTSKPIQITQIDGANPVFAPVPKMLSGNK